MGRNILSRTLRSPARTIELGVEAGQVVCPRRGIVDVERCFACGSYRGLREGPAEQLVCSPSSSADSSWAPYGVVPR